jgi:transposase
MLREISKMEQRYDAVMAVMQGGFSVTEAAQKFGVSRESVYRWMKRYEEGGLEALAEGSHRPKHSPLQTPGLGEWRRSRPPPRLVAIGDHVILLTYANFDDAELRNYQPRIIHVNHRNAQVTSE